MYSLICIKCYLFIVFSFYYPSGTRYQFVMKKLLINANQVYINANPQTLVSS